MRKRLLILLFCLFIAGGYLVTAWFLSFPEGMSVASPPSQGVDPLPRPLILSDESIFDEAAPESAFFSAGSEEEFAREIARDQAPPASFPEEITVHVSSDFRQGDLSNVISGEVLRMGDGKEFTPRGAPPNQRFGIYVSPEHEAGETFNEVIAASEALIPDGSELALEFRTRSADGAWSLWQRIEPNEMSQPIALSRPASAWQYRLNFFAPESAPGPEVDSVAFATRSAASGVDF